MADARLADASETKLHNVYYYEHFYIYLFIIINII